MSLIDDVRTCRRCLDRPDHLERFAKRFELCGETGYPKKFPPTIGSPGEAKLLFMGISPRLSNNYVLDAANENRHGEFVKLSKNKDQLDRNYLKSYDAPDEPRESHYRPYVAMIEQLYPGRAVEQVAAFTDLYHCAYPAKPPHFDSNYKPLPADSPCAARFFERAVMQVKPLAVITRGEPQTRFFGRHFVKGRVNYNTPYRIMVNGIETTLLPLRWRMDQEWLMEMIREMDPDAV